VADEDETSTAFVPSAPIGETTDPDSPLVDAARATCNWAGYVYSPGAQICAFGVLYTCQSNGTWHRDPGSC
jgi:hypothetical protein